MPGTMCTKRKRISASCISVCQLQEALDGWFTDRGSRSVQNLLKEFESNWTAVMMPKPNQLVHQDVMSLMLHLVRQDPTLHPRRKYVELALAAEHAGSNTAPRTSRSRITVCAPRTV